ncbi:MAG: HD-GYP domain-containing protein [Suilimivivens sp.]
MKNMDNNVYTVEYEKWSRLIIRVQLIIAVIVCVIEILNNVLLYVTRSQGYGPDTIVEKLIRYLLITSIFNFGMVVLSKVAEKRVENEELKRYFLMLFMTLMCADVAYSHYQFSVTFAIFTIPIIISILYEDSKLSIFTLIISLLGELLAVMARAFDDGYNKDIGPEAAIAFSLLLCVFVFARMINSTLRKRRDAVKEAVIAAEKANASAEKMILSMKMLETLAGTLDAKDKYTNGHSMRVAFYATRLAEALGWDKGQISMLRYEALLHDIGKIGVPDAILNKPSRLSEMEFGLIKSHTIVGSDILKNMVAVPGASQVARYHHERFDGKGYPSGRSGLDIPVNARIVCIADAYDAMSSDRIYRKALSQEKIREELINGRGSQFDPELLDKFVEMMDADKLNIIDTLSISESDTQQQNVLTDIENMIHKLSNASEQKKVINDFDKFYKYMQNIGLRYNHSVEVVQVEIEYETEDNQDDKLNEVSDLLQIAIRKNIRAVDMHYKYSSTKHIIILLDAGIDNIGVVQNRIQFDFDMNEMSRDYKLKFTLSDHMDAPGVSRGKRS